MSDFQKLGGRVKEGMLDRVMDKVKFCVIDTFYIYPFMYLMTKNNMNLQLGVFLKLKFKMNQHKKETTN